jgi:hypothetical protein
MSARGIEWRLAPAFPASNAAAETTINAGEADGHSRQGRKTGRPEGTQFFLGRQEQAGQGRSRRDQGGQRSDGKCSPAAARHQCHQAQETEDRRWWLGHRQGYHPVHPPTGHHDEGWRSPVPGFSSAREPTIPPWPSCSSTSRPMSRPAPTSPPRFASIRSTSTHCSATWSRPANRPVFSTACSTAWQPTRKNSGHQERRSRAPCSTRISVSWSPSSSPP